MPIDFGSPELTELVPKIAVIGVGGAGCNAVNNMIRADLQGVDFIVANTDAQSLSSALTDSRIQLGVEITRGLGAGAQPTVGEAAAEESIAAIDELLEGYHMAFITAGMGGGTGTGAAPVIAKRAREMGVLTVGVVTKPFQFEGARRMKLADAGIAALAEQVDTLIIIPNQNLFRVSNERTTFADAFNMADDVLHSGVRGVTDLMVMPGLINLDFADVRTVMSEMGKAMMGTGEASGETRSAEAASAAIANPLLEESSLAGAKGVIINVTGGMDMTLFEVDEAVNMVREQVDPEALIVFGSAFSDALEGKIRVSVVATGISGDEGADYRPVPQPVKTQTQPVAQPVSQPAAQTTERQAPATPATGPAATAAPLATAEGEAPQNPAPEAKVDGEAETAPMVSAPMVSGPTTSGPTTSEPLAPTSQQSAPIEAKAKPVVDAEAAALSRMVAKPFVAEPAMHPKAARTTFKPAVALRAVPDQDTGSVSGADVVSHPAANQPVRQAPVDTPPIDPAPTSPAPAPSAPTGATPRKKESLFSKMTAGLRASQPRDEQAQASPIPAPTQAPAPADAAREPAPLSSEGVAASSEGMAAVQPQRDTAATHGGDTVDRGSDASDPAAPKVDTGQLEIPSFLRRQQN